jgi:hypothetical protein
VATIGLLLDAGAKVEDDPDYPTGNQKVDDLLRSHGAK